MGKKEEHWEAGGWDWDSLKEFHSKTWEAAIASTKPEKPWPQKGGAIYFISRCGNPLSRPYVDDDRDRYMLSIGEVHSSAHAAERADVMKILKGKVLEMLKEKNGDWVADYEDATQEKWSIRFVQNVLNLSADYTLQHTKHVAKSREIWQEIIDKFGENEVAEVLEVK